MQYITHSIRSYFHHQTYPQLSIISTFVHHFIISGTISNCICSSPVAYWTLSNLVAHLLMSFCIFWCLLYLCICCTFLLFYTIHGFLVARIPEWLAISSSSEPQLSELSTMTCLPRVALHGIAHSSIELRKSLHCDKAVGHKGERTARQAKCIEVGRK